MMRKTIARRLTEAKQTVPHFYLNIDVDAAPLARATRATSTTSSPADAPGQGGRAQGLSVNDFLVKACALALLRVPECNASSRPTPSSCTGGSTSRSRWPFPMGSSRPSCATPTRRAWRPSGARCAISPRAPGARSSGPKRCRTGRSRSRTSACSASTSSRPSSTRPRVPSSPSVAFATSPWCMDGSVVAGKRLALTLVVRSPRRRRCGRRGVPRGAARLARATDAAAHGLMAERQWREARRSTTFAA